MLVVLSILKWLGIIFLVIVLLFLFLLSLILFVPVRYYVKGENIDEIQYFVRISFLFRVVSWSYRLNGKTCLKVFGIPIGKRKKKKTVSHAVGSETEEIESAKIKSAEIKSEKKRAKKEKKSHKNYFKSFIDFFKEKENWSIIKKFKNKIIKLLKYLVPYKVKGKVVFGTGDPCNTGLLTGLISLFPVFFQKGFEMNPDFQNKIFEFIGYVKGKIRLIRVLIFAIHILRDKEMMKVIKKLI